MQSAGDREGARQMGVLEWFDRLPTEMMRDDLTFLRVVRGVAAPRQLVLSIFNDEGMLTEFG